MSSRVPVTDRDRKSRGRLYVLSDGFLRFWFRYVFPFQADLESGLEPTVVVKNEIGRRSRTTVLMGLPTATPR